MRYSVTFFVVVSCLFLTTAAYADDSQRNKIAAKLKKSAQAKVAKAHSHYQGYCDLVVYLKHSEKYAIIEKVSGTGDTRICLTAKKAIKVGAKFRYQVPEKILIIHVSS